jgi:hypothetical protein
MRKHLRPAWEVGPGYPLGAKEWNLGEALRSYGLGKAGGLACPDKQKPEGSATNIAFYGHYLAGSPSNVPQTLWSS